MISSFCFLGKKNYMYQMINKALKMYKINDNIDNTIHNIVSNKIIWDIQLSIAHESSKKKFTF